MTDPRRRVLVCIPQPFMRAAPGLQTGLEELGLAVRVETPEFAVDSARLRELVRDVEILVVSTEHVTESVLRAGGELQMIVKHGAGVDNIDVAAATRRGIAVVNLPGLNADAVADLTVALVLALARRVVEAVQLVRGGGWGYLLGTELSGKTYGIIGTGLIGRKVLQRVAGFGLSLLGYDVAPDPALAAQLGLRYAPLDEVLATADVISLHVPLVDSTRGLFNRQAFRLMKRGVLLVNVSRGGVVDEDALLEALENGTVGGAALDVFAQEPPRRSRLLELPNVLPTPHIGGSTIETARRLAAACVEVIAAFLRGDRPRSLVNPEVWLMRMGKNLAAERREGG
ncbi:MAG: phosphoglycerate dehydrogenase [Armatimonadota bacterium]|nr:phosphoglycerate dehydrogenase [Armatimonadota bacterium]